MISLLKHFVKEHLPGLPVLVTISWRGISWADLIQMASACAIQATGGPVLPMRYGRVDVKDGVPRMEYDKRAWGCETFG